MSTPHDRGYRLAALFVSAVVLGLLIEASFHHQVPMLSPETTGASYDFTYSYALVGDWNGDGIKTAGVFFRGGWGLNDQNDDSIPEYVFRALPADGLPVAGDWDGDGRDSVGVFRDGRWYLKNRNDEAPADWIFEFGVLGDLPVVGDWDGDGKDSIGIFRHGRWHLRNHNAAGAPEMVFAFPTRWFPPG